MLSQEERERMTLLAKCISYEGQAVATLLAELEAVEKERDILRLEKQDAIKAWYCASDEVRSLRTERDRLREALMFYADPETYFAIGFFPDEPAGEFMDDFEKTMLGNKPGKRARAALEAKP